MAPPPPPSKFWQKSSALIEMAKDYYFGKEQPKPVISERLALLCALLFTVLYIAPFYLSKTLRTTPLNSRDSPSVIAARVRAVGLSCIASTIVTVYVLAVFGHAGPREMLRLFAMWPIQPLDCVKTLGLACVLFVGPLYEVLVVDGDWRRLSVKSVKETFWDNLPGFRNYVVAPWCEELVFRSLVISLYLLAKAPPSRIVFVSPLIFGMAHVHHLIEFCQARTPAGQTLPPAKVLLGGLIVSLFQFAYTSLFGFFAAFVYIRTGNVFATIAVHTFCNYMGLPRVWGKVGQASDLPDMTPDVAQGKRDDSVYGDQVRVGNSLMQDNEKAAPGSQNLGLAWTVVYYGLLVVGMVGFYQLLWPMTESTNALIVL